MRRGASGAGSRLAALLAGAALVLAWVGPAAAADDAADGEERLRTLRAQEADATATVADLELRLRRIGDATAALAVASSQAVEAYDAALARLTHAQADAAATASTRWRAAEREDQARAQLGRLASAAYRSGGSLADLSLVLSFEGTQDLVSRLTAVRFVGDSMARSLAELSAAEAAATALEEAAAQRAVAEQEAVTVLARAREAVETLLEEREKRMASLTAERDTVVRALAALHRRTVAAERRLLDAAAGSVPGAAGVPPPDDPARAAVVSFALAQIGKPYLWAADGPDAFDCSGLTSQAWAQAGITLPHYSVEQYDASAPLALGEAEAGDLVFYATDPADPRTIYHVGLYVGAGLMVEAPHPGTPVRLAAVGRTGLLGAARPGLARG